MVTAQDFQLADLEQFKVELMWVLDIEPAYENDNLYKPVDENDPEIRALALSIKENGVLEPLVISEDNIILSGHRRYAAANLAGLDHVPCRKYPISRGHSDEDVSRFMLVIREFNRQRKKTTAEEVREAVLATDKDSAYRNLILHRQAKAMVSVGANHIIKRSDYKERSKISDAKKPMLDTVKRVIEINRKFCPLSDRQIHYGMLNFQTRIHAKKPELYGNNLKSYKALCELLTRARLELEISWDDVGDATRPVETWDIHQSPRTFIRGELDGFMRGYYRDLMQSQACHFEIVGEKNTIGSVISPIAAKYTIPLTIGRGYCSIAPRHAMAERFKKSGRDKLVLLIMSDLDPDGEVIASSFLDSLERDFSISNIHAIKVGINKSHVEEFNLPPSLEAKESSSQFKKFHEEHGRFAYELESVSAVNLQKMLETAILSTIDVDAFNREVEMEAQDAVTLEAYNAIAIKAIGGHAPLDDEA